MRYGKMGTCTYRDVVDLRETAPGPTDSTEGVAFIEDKPILILVLQFNQLGQIGHRSVACKDTLGDDEPPGERAPPLLALLLDLLQHLLERVEVVVVVVADGRAGDLDSFLDGKVDIAVCDNDVAALTEGGDDGGEGGEALGVEDGGLGSKEVGDVAFEVHVHILKCN